MSVFENDREIMIAIGKSRKSINWSHKILLWSELVEKLKTPVHGTETLDEYLKLPKSKQDDLKDVGGFIGGTLAGNRRKASNVTGRDIITLDLDNIPAFGTDDVLNQLDDLECAYVTYSTRKHEDINPRLRVIIPLDRTASVDEYEPLARKLASIIDIEFSDPTTFEVSRLMYWPSCCSDSQYVFQSRDKPFMKVDEVLGLYNDWKNVSEWPEVPGANEKHMSLIKKQGNPEEKAGIIGVFCRQYDIHDAIETFLSDIYLPAEDGSDRYTFAGGSTVGGAVIYDKGLFLYSHHATDPCSGKLVNAFDLVRFHKFGEQDDGSNLDTPINKLPSFISMAKFASEDPKIRRQQIEDDFGDEERFQGESLDWLEQLERKPKGKGFAATPKNVKLIIKNDPAIAGKFARDIFAYRDLLLGSVPWRKIKKPQAVDEDDDSGLRNFLADEYRITRSPVIDDALSEVLLASEFHPVQEYLKSLTWDGINRVETVLIDYLGAEDNELTRAMTRLTLTGAVARVFRPGCKFDYVLTLIGKQGIGKSSLIALLGGEWYTDSLEDVRGKDACEQIQGSWIVELGELAALRKADVEAIKRFVSAQVDKFRQAYARRSKDFPRQCIFIASTNDEEPLKDQTGNRRFWPVPVGVHPVQFEKRKNFPRDQIWAEAMAMFKKSEPLVLPDHLEKQAKEMQKAYTEESIYAGMIREYLDKPWDGDFVEDGKIRDKVCAIEIWCDLLNLSRDKFTTAKAREINLILKNTPGWRIYPKNNGRTRHGNYGLQTVFEREIDL